MEAEEREENTGNYNLIKQTGGKFCNFMTKSRSVNYDIKVHKNCLCCIREFTIHSLKLNSQLCVMVQKYAYLSSKLLMVTPTCRFLWHCNYKLNFEGN